jgi:alkylation response protein AidB-like acyl-CoA dehydrogenase
MVTYAAPLKDMQFVLSDLLNAPAALAQLPRYEEVDADLIAQVLEEAGRFASEVLFPLNASGDREGCRYDSGAVATPAGYAQAYRQFCEAGWPAMSCDPEDGGQGLPHILNTALVEMLSAANHGWTMYPGLLHGAYACLRAHASEELKARYLPKIASGEWLPTMCLTEPSAGSDLGLLRTKASAAGDGSYRITGNKIFISGGEHDLTDNIVHLVLARLPDAPAGSKGISLFLVPKVLPDGARNAVHCTGIEHKMGLRGSATCSMQFDGATGWLVGEPHRGLAAMFVMMNAARLNTGIQALGLADAAYLQAAAYAEERLQLKAPLRRGREQEAADPIAMHPPVQRLLKTQRAIVEGGRMLAYWTALQLDAAEHHPDAATRHVLHEQVSLITPIIKAMFSDQGFQSTSLALQVFGGHGYICETGIEQYLRDVRVMMLYEGTNEIQGVDLLVRKVLGDGGKRLDGFLAQIEEYAQAESGGPVQTWARLVLDLTEQTGMAAQSIAAAAAKRPELPYQLAGDMLRLVGHCALAWCWLRAASVACRREDKDPAFFKAKQDTARHYFTCLLPETLQLLGVIDAALLEEAPRPRLSIV